MRLLLFLALVALTSANPRPGRVNRPHHEGKRPDRRWLSKHLNHISMHPTLVAPLKHEIEMILEQLPIEAMSNLGVHFMALGKRLLCQDNLEATHQRNLEDPLTRCELADILFSLLFGGKIPPPQGPKGNQGALQHKKIKVQALKAKLSSAEGDSAGSKLSPSIVEANIENDPLLEDKFDNPDDTLVDADAEPQNEKVPKGALKKKIIKVQGLNTKLSSSEKTSAESKLSLLNVEGHIEDGQQLIEKEFDLSVDWTDEELDPNEDSDALFEQRRTLIIPKKKNIDY